MKLSIALAKCRRSIGPTTFALSRFRSWDQAPLAITMEVGEIARFKSDGDFASYCRAVDSRRLSNGKQKGENNQKCWNKYLSWALVEAANFAKRYDENCRR